MDDLLKRIAQEVDDLIREPAGMQYFRQMIEKYGWINKEYQEAVQANEQEFEDNCRALLKDKRLQDRKAGSPDKGWSWIEGIDFEEYVDKNGEFRDKEIDIRGWFPPAKVKIPPNPWPWELGCDNELTSEDMLPAEYLLLACCHDCMLTGRPAIINNDFVKKCCEFDLSIWIYQRGSDVEHQKSIVRPCSDELEPALKDVQLDIQKQDFSTKTEKKKAKTSKKKRGRPSDTEEEKKKDKRIYEGWGNCSLRTKAEYAREIGEKTLFVKQAIERHRKRLCRQKIAVK